MIIWGNCNYFKPMEHLSILSLMILKITIVTKNCILIFLLSNSPAKSLLGDGLITCSKYNHVWQRKMLNPAFKISHIIGWCKSVYSLYQIYNYKQKCCKFRIYWKVIL